jgi:hypothetical protein
MKKIIIGWNWKRYSFILGIILLFVAFVLGSLSGGESTATANSDACDKYFVGMALRVSEKYENESIPVAIFEYVVHAISKERGLLTYKREYVEEHHQGQGHTTQYVHQPLYATVSCSNVVMGSTKLYPNVYE